MKQIAGLLAYFLLLHATAHAHAQELAPAGMASTSVHRSIPASAVDAEGAYIEYAAKLSDGKSAIELGRYLSPSDCLHRLDRAFASPEFAKSIRQHPFLEAACVATRAKA